MVLIHRTPFREMDSLHREMTQLLDDVFTPSIRKGDAPFIVPAVEMEETSDAILLKAEIPGVDAKDLDIQVTADSVLIRGDRKSEVRTEQHYSTRSEFRYGTFQRVIPLSVRINNQKVKADYKNGVLSLNLPKAEDEKNKVFKVSLA
ncbi:MAG: Hsp20/alpha crystallin family protein [Elainellaceae cyanobacterium]